LTVKENVFMSDEEPENSNEILEQSLIASDISEKFKNMPLKYDTVLSREFDEHGTILSGGEYQKVALSRVFAKNSGIVILDEPSSALDPIAEYKMYKNMMDVCKDKTVIFISHRLSSAVMADKIFLFDNGRIIESGTHKELIALNKKYADMFNKQAEKYKAKEPVAV
ncbi:MAG: ABC transporter ATP-binding protein, partial [Clostridiales bacterium]